MKTLPIDERYSGRFFSLGDVFDIIELDKDKDTFLRYHGIFLLTAGKITVIIYHQVNGRIYGDLRKESYIMQSGTR